MLSWKYNSTYSHDPQRPKTRKLTFRKLQGKDRRKSNRSWHNTACGEQVIEMTLRSQWQIFFLGSVFFLVMDLWNSGLWKVLDDVKLRYLLWHHRTNDFGLETLCDNLQMHYSSHLHEYHFPSSSRPSGRRSSSTSTDRVNKPSDSANAIPSGSWESMRNPGRLEIY